MEYTEITLKSGTIVSLRGRSYAEWEEFETDRFARGQEVLQQVKEEPPLLPEAPMQALLRELREKRLRMSVKEWSEHKTSLSLRDVKEIERLLDALEQEEVEAGN